uniref:Uncharacterized protein n=1 Tax=Anguilla anguilla TaxID=7936 RepID=A0A0E9UWJ6_ANGAN
MRHKILLPIRMMGHSLRDWEQARMTKSNGTMKSWCEENLWQTRLVSD